MARFNTQNHRIGYVRLPSESPNDSWHIGPVKTAIVPLSAIASGKAATLPLEELTETPEESRRKKALKIIEKVRESETKLDLHHTGATLKLRRAIAHLEDLGGYHLFGFKDFESFWNEYFPNCGNHQRARWQSLSITVLRLLDLPIDCEAPTSNALRPLFRLGVRDGVTSAKAKQKGANGRYQTCNLDRAILVKKAWQRACELAGDRIPTEKETAQAVRELSRIYPEIAPPKTKKTLLEDRVRQLTTQLDEATNKIKALEQLNQELRSHLAKKEEGR